MAGAIWYHVSRNSWHYFIHMWSFLQKHFHPAMNGFGLEKKKKKKTNDGKKMHKKKPSDPLRRYRSKLRPIQSDIEGHHLSIGQVHGLILKKAMNKNGRTKTKPAEVWDFIFRNKKDNWTLGKSWPFTLKRLGLGLKVHVWTISDVINQLEDQVNVSFGLLHHIQHHITQPTQPPFFGSLVGWCNFSPAPSGHRHHGQRTRRPDRLAGAINQQVTTNTQLTKNNKQQ